MGFLFVLILCVSYTSIQQQQILLGYQPLLSAGLIWCNLYCIFIHVHSTNRQSTKLYNNVFRHRNTEYTTYPDMVNKAAQAEKHLIFRKSMHISGKPVPISMQNSPLDWIMGLIQYNFLN